MEKAILVTVDNQVSVVDFPEPTNEAAIKAINATIGSDCFETVSGCLPDGHIMVVDESGLIKSRPVNLLASGFYGFDKSPIVGDVLFLMVGLRNGERDLIGFSAEEAEDYRKMYADTLELLLSGEPLHILV